MITTQVKRASNDATVSDGASVPLGTSVYDTATLTGATATAGGTVQYFYAGPLTQAQDDAFTCASGTSLGAKNVTNGSPANSDATGPLNAAGIYEFWAVYSGDNNNDGKTSTCKLETVVVDKANPSVSTQVKNTNGTVATDNDTPIANGGNVSIGTTAYDAASVTGGSSPTGTVQFYVEKGDATCSVASATDLGSKALGTASNTYTFASAGTYYFWAVYSGDGNNSTQTSACDSETVVVDRNSPDTLTQVKNTNGTAGTGDDTPIANGGNVSIGTTAYDTATVGGATGGTVQFYVEKGDATCSVASATDLGSKALGTASNTYEFTTAGTYYFWAVYSGDDNNNGSTSSCDSETVVVDQNTTGITTQVKNNADDKDINNGTNVAIGTVAYDTADVTGETTEAGGTVQLLRREGRRHLLRGRRHRRSAPSVAGRARPNTYHVHHGRHLLLLGRLLGDANNNGATSACDSEIVVVDQNTPGSPRRSRTTPTTRTCNNGANVAIGTVAYDTADADRRDHRRRRHRPVLRREG